MCWRKIDKRYDDDMWPTDESESECVRAKANSILSMIAIRCNVISLHRRPIIHKSTGPLPAGEWWMWLTVCMHSIEMRRNLRVGFGLRWEGEETTTMSYMFIISGFVVVHGGFTTGPILRWNFCASSHKKDINYTHGQIKYIVKCV